MMKTEFHFLTLFPQVIEPYMSTSILGRALGRGLFKIQTHQLRDYAEGAHRAVDDTAYGGGGGMVMRVDVLAKAVESIRQNSDIPTKVVYFSPKGKKINQDLVNRFAQNPIRWILVCGHYEGVDQRFIDAFVDEEISLGDFVITGGELPALAFADALARQLEGTVKHENGAVTESFSLKDKEGNLLLEYPHYTRPRVFREFSVPEILLSGDHAAIEKWREENSRLSD